MKLIEMLDLPFVHRVAISLEVRGDFYKNKRVRRYIICAKSSP